MSPSRARFRSAKDRGRLRRKSARKNEEQLDCKFYSHFSNWLCSSEEKNNEDEKPAESEEKPKAQTPKPKTKPAAKKPAAQEQPVAEQDKPEYAGIAVQRGIGMVFIYLPEW